MKYSHKSVQEDHLVREMFLKTMDLKLLSQLIDSTILKPETTKFQIEQMCMEADEFQFRSVCVPPVYVPTAKKILANSKVKVCTVVGFPLGFQFTQSKVNEIKEAISLGVHELDFVQNLTFVKNNDFSELKKEFQEIVRASEGHLLKVILETALLTSEEILKCSLLAAQNGIHMIKTSTGFSSRGASANDIEMIQKSITSFFNETGVLVGIKASGGIRSAQDAQSLVKMGATRLGTSGGSAIIQQDIRTSSFK